jgi:hypothetical protein
MKLYQVIAATCIAGMTLASCSNSSTTNDELNNQPSVDSMSVPDTINQNGLPAPDSTNMRADSLGNR